MTEVVLHRRPLRDEVCELIMSRIVRGVHPVGERIHEGRLAEVLGVSRTPVREGLMKLEQLGILEVRPNSGFYVLPVTQSDIQQVYPIIAALESLAVELTPKEDFDDLMSGLVQLAAEMEALSDQGDVAEELDQAFHALLVSKCRNDRLIAMIADLKRISGRYEPTYMSDSQSVAVSAAQHRAIVDALAGAQYEEAARLTEDNWLSGMGRLLANR